MTQRNTCHCEPRKGRGNLLSHFPAICSWQILLLRKLVQSKVQAVLEEYYAARGWSKLGIPGARKLKELGLELKE